MVLFESFVPARRGNAQLLEEYQRRLEELKNKYPNHARAALAGIDAFMAAKDQALVLIAQANEQTDPAEKERLLEEGRQKFSSVLTEHPTRGLC